MMDTDGTAQHQRQNIADIFATFYEQLYKDPLRNTHSNLNDASETARNDHMPAFTATELDEALKYVFEKQESPRCQLHSSGNAKIWGQHLEGC